MSKQQRQSFMIEALVISASNLIVKVIGMLFKIPLSGMLQLQGMSIFNAAYSIYAMLYMISTAGLPVAISRLVSASASQKRGREIKKVYKMSLVLFGLIGLFCTLLMFFGAGAIAKFSKHSDAVIAMRVISPTLFLVCISSAVRGYFQGLRNMIPTAVSQFIEAFIKFAAGIGAVAVAIKMGASPAVQAAAGISGLTLGMFLATLYLFAVKKRFNKKKTAFTSPDSLANEEIFKKILAIALPVTITSSALYFSQFLDTLIIKKILIESGVLAQTADSLYSAYTTLSLSISDLLPATLVYPIAISILPSVSAALATNNNREVNRYIHNSIRISGIIAMPCAFGLFAVARQAIAFIYGASWGNPIIVNGIEKMPIDIAAKSLQILAIGIIFISLLSTTNALLQACGKTEQPMISVGIALLFLISAEVLLISVKPIGIYGAPISSVLFYFIALMLNLLALRKHRRYIVPLSRLFLKPLICGLLCGGSAMLAVKLAAAILPNERRFFAGLTLGFAATVGASVYIITMLLCKGISRDEVLLLPKGRSLHDFLEKRGYFK